MKPILGSWRWKGVAFPLTPALSLREREKPRPPSPFSRASVLTSQLIEAGIPMLGCRAPTARTSTAWGNAPGFEFANRNQR